MCVNKFYKLHRAVGPCCIYDARYDTSTSSTWSHIVWFSTNLALTFHRICNKVMSIRTTYFSPSRINGFLLYNLPEMSIYLLSNFFIFIKTDRICISSIASVALLIYLIYRGIYLQSSSFPFYVCILWVVSIFCRNEMQLQLYPYDSRRNTPFCTTLTAQLPHPLRAFLWCKNINSLQISNDFTSPRI